jgi:hypothetical protein
MLLSKITGNNGSHGFAKAGLAKIRHFTFTRRPSGELQWLLTPKNMKGKQ